MQRLVGGGYRGVDEHMCGAAHAVMRTAWRGPWGPLEVMGSGSGSNIERAWR